MNQEKKSDFVNLQFEYLNQLKKKFPNKEEQELIIENFPFGWFSSLDYEGKTKILNQAMAEGKSLKDYEESFRIANQRPIQIKITPVETNSGSKSK